MNFEIKNCDVKYSDSIFPECFINHININFELKSINCNKNYKYISQFDLEEILNIVYNIFSAYKIKVECLENEKLNEYLLKISFLEKYKFLNIHNSLNEIQRQIKNLLNDITDEPPKKIRNA